MTPKTLSSIFAVLISSLPLSAQTKLAPPPPKQQGVPFNDRKIEEASRKIANKGVPSLAGVSIGFDLAGAAMATLTSSGQYEVSLRSNIHNKYFPIFEIGIGKSNQTNEDTQLRFKTRAPYFRLGLDYNLNKNLRNKNRVFVGLRYAFSPFSYDLSGSDVQSHDWGTQTPYNFSGVSGKMHWGEALFGLESEIWKFIHLGWSVRYRLRIHEKQSTLGHAWYVPGYGKNNGSNNWGASFNIVVDLNRFSSTPPQIKTAATPPPQSPSPKKR